LITIEDMGPPPGMMMGSNGPPQMRMGMAPPQRMAIGGKKNKIQYSGVVKSIDIKQKLNILIL